MTLDPIPTLPKTEPKFSVGDWVFYTAWYPAITFKFRISEIQVFVPSMGWLYKLSYGYKADFTAAWEDNLTGIDRLNSAVMRAIRG